MTCSHNLISTAAWRLSLQICHTVESCQFCWGLTYHGWQLWPGRQLGSPQCVSRITPADTCSVNRDVLLCGSSQWLKMTLQALLRCLSSLGSVQDVMTRAGPRCFGGYLAQVAARTKCILPKFVLLVHTAKNDLLKKIHTRWLVWSFVLSLALTFCVT